MKTFTRQDFHIGVLSAHRPANVVPLSALLGNVTWYVPPAEVEVYKQHGAEFVVPVPVPEGKGGNIPEARNAMLRDAEALGKFCVQSDDDLKKIMRIDDDEKKTAVPASFEEAIFTMAEKMEETGAYLCGTAPTPNTFYYNKPFSENLFIIASLMVIKPSGLFFDENLRLKEDYDYTLQHITKHGKVIRCNRLLPHYQHYSNKGGAVAIRNHSLEVRSIDYLKSKWGDMIKINPRRQDEILLKVKKK